MRKPYKIAAGVLAGVLVVSIGTLAILMSYTKPCGVVPAAGTDATLMRANVARCYGPPDVIKVEQIPKPAPADNRIIVKVHAASVNPYDWHSVRGEPYVIRLFDGFGAPDDPMVGVDFAGTVESVGKNVTRFKPGDAVFGSGDGAFAEFISVREAGAVTGKPDNMTFEQAAAVPIAAVTALQALREKGHVQAGQNVLINGASGGVGTFAVQIAKAYGARVTAVCSTKNVAMVRAIGADSVIDYTREDYTRGEQRYDLIIDNVGNRSMTENRRVMMPHGALVAVGGQDNNPWLIGTLWHAAAQWIIAPFISQRFLFILAQQDKDNLATLRDLMQDGKMTPVIDRRYALSEVPAALRYLEAGHARGKVIVRVE